MNNEPKLTRGYVQVYTGKGKGKTTAALGIAFRAMGYGLRTYIGQFLKGQHYSELKSAEICRQFVTIEQYGLPSFIYQADEEDLVMARNGLDKAKAAMYSNLYDIVVFDEINTANYLGFVSIEQMLEIIESKPNAVEIIFTGRNAPIPVIEAADLVTEMVEIKHYYHAGVKARFGIEK